MPRNGSGVYSAPAGGSYPAAEATLIEAGKHNTLIADIITELSNSLAKDGQTQATGNIPMGGFKLTGMGNGSAATDSATLAQAQSASGQWCGTAGGTANALTLTPLPAITSYAAGQIFRFKSAAENTGATTVNISGIGAIAIQRNGAALSGGEISNGQWYEIILSDATTAQLNRLGQISGLEFIGSGVALASNSTLIWGQAGKWFEIQAGSLTITLPALGATAGRTFTFRASTFGFTLAGNGADQIRTNAASAGTLAVAAGEYITVAENGASGWYVVARGLDTVSAATQAQMEAASSNAVAATPGNIKWHPGVSKAWIKCDAAGNINASMNVSSIVDNGSGDVTVNLTTAFSSTNYSISPGSLSSGASRPVVVIAQNTNSFRLQCHDASGATSDPTAFYASCDGDQ